MSTSHSPSAQPPSRTQRPWSNDSQLIGGAPGAALAFLAQELAPAEALMRKMVVEGDPDFTTLYLGRCSRSALHDTFKLAWASCIPRINFSIKRI